MPPGDVVALQAGDARAVVDAARGGALASLEVAGQELLVAPTNVWQPYPRWGSFLMAPWVGPLSDARLPFRGQVHKLAPNEGRHAVHGLVAGVPWEVERSTGREVALRRGLDGLWPFGGVVRQEIALDPSFITLAVEIQAGAHAMPVAAGWHPWFRRRPVPMRVRVAASQILRHVNELPTGDIDPLTDETDLRGAPDLGDRRIDVVYLGAESPAGLTTESLDLTVQFDPAIETVVVYTPPEAVCVEPWSAWPDASRLAERGGRTGLGVLDPGGVFRRWTRWEWTVRT